MPSSGDPLEDVLTRWLSPDVLRGQDPFDAEQATLRCSQHDLIRMFFELYSAVAEVTKHSSQGRWGLTSIATELSACYVPSGSYLLRRTTHAGLFGDLVLVEPPRLPTYYGYPPLSLAAALEDPSRPVRRLPEPPRIRNEIDEVMADFDAEFTKDLSASRVEALLDLPRVTQRLLSFVWDVRQPRLEGWLVLIDGGQWDTSNAKSLRRVPEFRTLTDDLYDQDADKMLAGWRIMFNSYGLGHELGRNRVLTAPSDLASAQLIAATARIFHDLDYGAPLIGMPGFEFANDPSTRASSAPQRLGWFDELLVGLGPFTECLDGFAVCELRNRGLRGAISHWLESDLQSVAEAVAAGEDPKASLGQASRRLADIAKLTEDAISNAASATFRSRLKQGGLWGAGTGVLAFVGTVASGGAMGLAACLAAFGFAVAASVGGAAPDAIAPRVPETVLLDLREVSNQARRRTRMRSDT